MLKTLFNHQRIDSKGHRFSFAGVVDGNSISIGVCKCSKKDIFTKEFGRHISEQRAYKKPIATIEFAELENPSYVFNRIIKEINLNKILK